MDNAKPVASVEGWVDLGLEGVSEPTSQPSYHWLAENEILAFMKPGNEIHGYRTRIKAEKALRDEKEKPLISDLDSSYPDTISPDLKRLLWRFNTNAHVSDIDGTHSHQLYPGRIYRFFWSQDGKTTAVINKNKFSTNHKITFTNTESGKMVRQDEAPDLELAWIQTKGDCYRIYRICMLPNSIL